MRPDFKLSVYDRPQTKGSAKALIFKGRKFPVVINDNNKNRRWAKTVREEAQQVWKRGPIQGPVLVSLLFCFNRPKSVKREWCTVAPDVDKLARSVHDALEGVLYKNDAQIVSCYIQKSYGPREGVYIEVVNLTKTEKRRRS